MIIKQLSVKLKNEPGELSAISDVLGDAGINIRALNAAVHGKDAQVHMVVDEHEKARDTLSSRGYELSEYEVLAVETPDHPGGLNAVLRPLKEEGINIEFLYPLIGRMVSGNAVLIIGPDRVDDAVRTLQGHYINILEKGLRGL